MNRLAVLGQPIGHSLSPVMHAAAFEALGIGDRWTYEAIELAPEDFGRGVRRLRVDGYLGANVTVPHKRRALELADDATEAARAIGAANTLTFSPAGIRAANTDAPGLLAALPTSAAGRRALVLGAGGAARAAVWALLEAGADVSVHNRTTARADELVADLGGTVLVPDGDLPLGDFDIVVNATSVGLAREGAPVTAPGGDLKELGIAADSLSDHLVVVDLVYGTTNTDLVAAAARGGATVIDGLEILVHQGAESFRIWTGAEPPLEIMRRSIRNLQR
ncbi:MAG: shikimate dehydrogenase [Solirubrobacterales bacterium]